MVHHNLVVGAEDGQRFNMLFDEQKMDVGDHLGSCHSQRVGSLFPLSKLCYILHLLYFNPNIV